MIHPHPTSHVPTARRMCPLCRRAWSGRAVAKHFHQSYTRPEHPYQGYCIDCMSVYQAAHNALGDVAAVVDVPTILRDKGSARMLRIWYKEKLSTPVLGRCIAEDILRRYPRSSGITG
jgi:hypothetical protein